MILNRFAVVVMLLLLGACATNETIEPPAELIDFEPAAKFDQVWSVSLSDDGEDKLLGLRPAYDGERIYAADFGGTIVAVDAGSGDTVWEFETDDSFWGGGGLPFSSGPAVGEGMVAVGTINGDLLVLDAVTGEQVWQKNIDAEMITAPVINAGKLLVRTGEGRLISFDLASGNTLWDTVREMPLLSLRGQSQPTVKDGVVYSAWDNGKVSALSMATGAPKWETSIGQAIGTSEVQLISDIDGDVVVFGAELYVAGHNTNLAALAVESGEVLWREEMSSVRGPAVSYGSVIITDIDSVIRAYDRLSGTSLWTQDVIRARYLTGPAIWKDFVVVGDFEGYVHVFDRTTGKMLARFSHDGEPVNATPLVAGDLLVVLSADGELAAYRQVETKD